MAAQSVLDEGFAPLGLKAAADPNLSDAAKVLFAIITYRAYASGECFAKVRELAGMLGWQERKVQRALSVLRQHGYVGSADPKLGGIRLVRRNISPVKDDSVKTVTPDKIDVSELSPPASKMSPVASNLTPHIRKKELKEHSKEQKNIYTPDVAKLDSEWPGEQPIGLDGYRFFSDKIESPEDEELFYVTLAVWKQKWAMEGNRFVPKLENHLSKDLWKKTPVLPRPPEPKNLTDRMIERARLRDLEESLNEQEY